MSEKFSISHPRQALLNRCVAAAAHLFSTLHFKLNSRHWTKLFNKFLRRRSVRGSCVNSNESVDRVCGWRYYLSEIKSAKHWVRTAKWSGNGTTIVGTLIPFYELAIACRKSLWCSQPARGFEDSQTLTTLAPCLTTLLLCSLPITLSISQLFFPACGQTLASVFALVSFFSLRDWHRRFITRL